MYLDDPERWSGAKLVLFVTASFVTSPQPPNFGG